jgi:hypothetical protein
VVDLVVVGFGRGFEVVTAGLGRAVVFTGVGLVLGLINEYEQAA